MNLTDKEINELSALFSSMPYGGMCDFAYPVDSLEKIKINLEKLKTRLTQHGTQCEKDKEELANLKYARLAIRHFLGLGGGTI